MKLNIIKLILGYFLIISFLPISSNANGIVFEEIVCEIKINKKTRKQEKSLCHGLLRCKSDTHNCGIIHNRDKNALSKAKKNMLNIIAKQKNEIIYRNTRPCKFTRSE